MRRTTLSIVCLATMLGVSACQPSVSGNNHSALTDGPCQTHSVPFSYSTCHIDEQALAGEGYSLQLFWQAPDSQQPLFTFDNLINTLPASDTLSFAMNAGMYNKDFAPIGYTVIAGKESRALNLKEGGGNFHLMPNGVLWWDKVGNVQVTESNALDQQIKDGIAKPWYATQSGPMLVIDGRIHPKFNPESTSLKYRNGVGVCTDGRIQFVNSAEPVNFYQFAALFKDDLKCSNALFLDGGIASAIYAPNLNRYDKKNMGVIVGLVENKD